MFSILPLVRSSTTWTRAPRSTKASTRCDPMNEVPPVTRTFLRSQMMASVFFASRFFHNFNEAVKFVHSNIFFRGFPGATAHFREPCGTGAQLANGGSHRGWVVRISCQTAPGFNDDARRVAIRSGHGEHGASRRENGVKFARHDHALEASAHSDYVQIARHHDVRQLLDGPERQKTNVRQIRRG